MGDYKQELPEDYMKALPPCLPKELKTIILDYSLSEEFKNLLSIIELKDLKQKCNNSIAKILFCAVFGFDVRDVNTWVDSYYEEDITLQQLHQKCINKLMRIEK